MVDARGRSRRSYKASSRSRCGQLRPSIEHGAAAHFHRGRGELAVRPEPAAGRDASPPTCDLSPPGAVPHRVLRNIPPATEEIRNAVEIVPRIFSTGLSHQTSFFNKSLSYLLKVPRIGICSPYVEWCTGGCTAAYSSSTTYQSLKIRIFENDFLIENDHVDSVLLTLRVGQPGLRAKRTRRLLFS